MRRISSRLKDKKGLTLLEVVVASSLAMVLLIVVLEMSWHVWGVFGKSKVHFDETSELRKAIYWVTRDLRSADKNTIVIVDAKGIEPHTLTMKIGTADVVTYKIDSSNNLVRIENNIIQRTIASGIAFDKDEFNFKEEDKVSGTLVTVTFNGVERAKEGKEGLQSCIMVY
ncbi:hypothetical protein ACETAC_04010 [Aceticella autotrophica]|uniref:Prepilin-type N-terminal cleavage/methylation domain-containing protein n=1 Tax=Aceticella autotrophica TaxID=2755338 RepID=A0A975GBC5_9THEO|nr:hypothetical protein [Aceticella autotrophica]QSZ28031.1 hypothetical protein ACETAC_04010 [Aceticella autotrophica]